MVARPFFPSQICTIHGLFYSMFMVSFKLRLSEDLQGSSWV